MIIGYHEYDNVAVLAMRRSPRVCVWIKLLEAPFYTFVEGTTFTRHPGLPRSSSYLKGRANVFASLASTTYLVHGPKRTSENQCHISLLRLYVTRTTIMLHPIALYTSAIRLTLSRTLELLHSGNWASTLQACKYILWFNEDQSQRTREYR